MSGFYDQQKERRRVQQNDRLLLLKYEVSIIYALSFNQQTRTLEGTGWSTKKLLGSKNSVTLYVLVRSSDEKTPD